MTTDFSDLSAAPAPLVSTDKLLLVRPNTGLGDPYQIDMDDLTVYLSGAAPVALDVPAANMWRVRALSPASKDVSLGFGVSEFRFLDGSSTNIATGGTPISSGTASGWSLAQAFDGSTASSNGWYGAGTQAAAANTWIGYDFGTPTLPVHVAFAPLNGFPTAIPPQFALEYYDAAGDVWVTVKTYVTGAAANDTFQTFDFPSTYPVPVNAPVRSKWQGAQMLAIGDSITAASPSWADRAAALLGCGELIKVATSGWEASDALTAMSSVDTTLTGIIAILIGTNEFANGTAIGAIGDDASDSTFYGYYSDLILSCLADNKYSRLCLITPMHRTSDSTPNGAGKTLKDYRDAIIAMGEYYGVPVWDAYAESGFGPATLSTFTSDGVHPQDGGYYLGSAAAAFLAAH